MKFEEMLLKRESCRSYIEGKSVSREDLMKICEAGRMTPSGCNAQPWKFLLIDSPEAKEKLCDALVIEGGKTAAAFRHQVPAFIAVVEQPAKLIPIAMEYYKDSQRFAQGDVGAACLNMCYQALELGLNTCIIGMVDQGKMESYFGVPAGQTVRMVLAVGYGKDCEVPRKKARKPIEEVVCCNEWQ